MKYELSINFLILASFNLEDLKELTIYIEKSGFTMIHGLTKEILNNEEAALILTKSRKVNDNFEFLSLKYQNFFIKILAAKDDLDYLNISFSPQGELFTKKFQSTNQFSINTQYYIGLCIDLLKEYKILNIHVTSNVHHCLNKRI